MKSMMWKSTLREIKQSLGRYLAILAIVALGVGFFAGLKVTREAMVATTQRYLEEKQFFDFRVVTTLGLDEEEVKLLASQEDVRAAEGSYTYDILCLAQDGSEIVLKAHTLLSSVNGVELVAGRMPQEADECVVDSSLYGASQIGQKIVLSADNEKSDRDVFACDAYTIVGIVQSSYYIQFERGNSSLGTGRVSGFFYLLPEGFVSDYYTEAFVRFDQDYALYSQEYRDYMDRKEEEWEPLLEQIAAGRYEKVRELSGEKLADARKELADGRAEGEKELSDAWDELVDAELEIRKGEQELEDSAASLEEARNTIEKKEKELNDAEETIKKEEKRLADGEEELAENKAAWEEQNTQVQAAVSELDTQQAMLDAQSLPLRAAQIQIEAGRMELSLISDEEERQKLNEQLLAGQAQVMEGLSVIASYQEQIDEGRRQLEEAKNQLSEGLKQIEAAQKQISDGKIALDKGKADLADGRRQLADARAELEDGEKEIENAKKELADGRQEYEDGLAEYQDALSEFHKEIGDAEAEIEDAEKQIRDMEEAEGYLLGRDTNVGYVCFESDSNIVDGIADIFPVFFFAVAALVCITTMNRMVEEQRTQIGVLKALGYSEGRIMGKYLFYSGSAAVIGCIFGFFAGTWLFPRVIWTAYGLMYKVDTLIYVFNWKLALIALAVSCLCSVGTTWLSCRYELAEVSAELMRPKAPKAGKRVLLERVTFIWKRMKFLHKVSYRNIFRYKKRFFMMIIGISGCTALLVTGFGIKDSIANVAYDQFHQIQLYDVSVSFSDTVDAGLAKDLEETLGERAESCIYVMESSMDLLAGDNTKSINLLVFDENEDISPYLNFHTTDKEPLSVPAKGECILNRKLADDYDIAAGDTVTLRAESGKSMELTVGGINENFIYNYVYLTFETYESLMGEPVQCKTAYLNLAENVDPHLISASLMRLPEAANVTVNKDFQERIGSMMKSLDLIVLVVILAAAGLAFIVLYNLTNINITERVREIATIKVLGFYKNEAAAYVFRENVVLTLIGALAGLVLGHFLHLFVMNEIRVDMITFQIRVSPLSMLYSMLLTFGFSWFVNWIMGRKLDNISMTESLKSVD